MMRIRPIDRLVSRADGAVWVGSSRVPLETVILAVGAGSTPEEIVQDFSAISLSDAYAVISHYLRHQAGVDAYVERREAEGAVSREHIKTLFSSNELRDRILEKARARHSCPPT